MAVFQTLSPNDHVIAPLEAYYGVLRLLARPLHALGAGGRFRRYDRSRRASKSTRRRNTKLLWIETPSNPTLEADRYRSRGGDRASGRRAFGLRQHLVAAHSAPVRVRRGRGHAFDHEIFRRPQRRPGRRSDRAGKRTNFSSACARCRPSAARCRRRSIAGWSIAACKRSPGECARIAKTRGRLRRFSNRIRGSRACITRGSLRTRSTHSPRDR